MYADVVLLCRRKGGLPCFFSYHQDQPKRTSDLQNMGLDDVEQIVLPADMTSSKTGTFYFAYGSNLSPKQMSLRLRADLSSSVPVAVARLDAHSWIICQRGYANVVALPKSNSAADESLVWGLIYNLSAEDEARLDKFEGHDQGRNPLPALNPEPSEQLQKPYLQGNWDYNKHYLPVTVTKWLADPNLYGVIAPDWTAESYHSAPTSIRALVYVDEFRTTPGRINQEYIGRMNRAIRESIQLGLSQTWVDAIMRPYIPLGVEVNDDGYVGTDKGYVEAEVTETASRLKEHVVHEVG